VTTDLRVKKVSPVQRKGVNITELRLLAAPVAPAALGVIVVLDFIVMRDNVMEPVSGHMHIEVHHPNSFNALAAGVPFDYAHDMESDETLGSNHICC
jgi:hypothetical protein